MYFSIPLCHTSTHCWKYFSLMTLSYVVTLSVSSKLLSLMNILSLERKSIKRCKIRWIGMLFSYGGVLLGQELLDGFVPSRALREANATLLLIDPLVYRSQSKCSPITFSDIHGLKFFNRHFPALKGLQKCSHILVGDEWFPCEGIYVMISLFLFPVAFYL